MAKGKLSDDVKTFIVQSLACFDTPSVVVAAVKQEFGEVITRQSVEGYDPNKRAGANLSEKWKSLFEETRKTFLEDTSKIAISHRAVRLRALQRMAEKAETQGNMALAANLMEQAAKEVGDSYTNRRELTGKDGKDLPAAVSPVTIFQLPDNGRS
ncbi:DUF2280 domain-containing protein [Devosia sp. MC1541]|uniref:DUF2280 domain-containing protein n=1 Tax=Devosia sp. MC1541 TaxID=2725264 RepID=UPI00145E11D1|nr:DUF2280 domain-containing protein [Devosia sp. MC1541]